MIRRPPNSSAILGATIACLAITACLSRSSHPRTWPARLEEAERTLQKSTTSRRDRFYALPDGAKAAFEVGKFDKADRYAKELLQLAPEFPKDWNYGNAIHDGHMVLGRLALRRNDVEEAAKQLNQAGNTPGSPQLDSFGPNMSLASDMIHQDHRDAVLSYFGQCERFWSLGRSDLAEWEALVRQGKQPRFGANLVY